MRRRTFMTIVTTSTLPAIAGCLGGDDDDTETDDETDETTDDTDDDAEQEASEDTSNGEEDDEDRNETAPAVAFAYHFDVGNETLEITHAGGPNVSANRLSVSGVRIDAQGDWYELGEADPDDQVSAGDTIEIGANVDYNIELVWQDEDGDEVTIDQASGNETDGTASLPPNPSFAYTYDAAEETLIMDVTGGDSFSANRVSVTGEGLTSEGYWYEFGEAAPEETMSAGDTIEIDVESDFSLELIWESEDGAESILSRSHGPDH